MSDPGTCELRLTRRYDATPAEVWAALTEPGSIGRWLAPAVSVELAPGGAFVLANGVDARVLAVEPGRVLELDWRHGAEDRSVVRVELRADGGGTTLTLEHGRIEAPLGMAYMSRWSRALDRLVATP
ncbi:MAG TPA: SRPBCC domain-containing protein [Solirubrobacteraceae bacterium]|nr:SRPBCC domain-containing protein [Solirubrobacteraceae bacterium]